ALRRTAEMLPGQAAEAFLTLLEPTTLGLTTSVLMLAAASQGTPIGWVCDLLLVASAGWMVFDCADYLLDFVLLATFARTDVDLDQAAASLLHVVVTLGGAAFVGLILKFRPSRSAVPPPVEPGAPPATTLPAMPPSAPPFRYRGDRSGKTL